MFTFRQESCKVSSIPLKEPFSVRRLTRIGFSDIIYGKENGSQLKDAFSDLAMLNKLSKWTEEDWVDLMKE